MSKFIIGESKINYKLIRKKVKNITLRITSNGELMITAPSTVNSIYIKEVLHKKSSWIIKNINKLKGINEEKKEESFSNMTFLGQSYSIDFTTNPSRKKISLQIEEDRCKINVKPQIFEDSLKSSFIEEALDSFYKEKAKEVFNKRTNYFAEKLGVYPNLIRVKSQKTLWGSCSSKNNINYNLRLTLAPLDVLDYIVVHELCHLIHKNHSDEFWKEVKGLKPNYEENVQWLKLNGAKILK